MLNLEIFKCHVSCVRGATTCFNYILPDTSEERMKSRVCSRNQLIISIKSTVLTISEIRAFMRLCIDFRRYALYKYNDI